MSAKGVQGQNKKKRVQFSEQLGEEEEPSADALWKAARKRHKLETEDQQERQVGEASVKVDHESKHTLESDEEEDEKYEKLNVEDVEGLAIILFYIHFYILSNNNIAMMLHLFLLRVLSKIF